MAYNKTKLLESAQKYLNQGKTAHAIAEYQQILRHEPKDQVTLMTIGDLYVRLGETFQALDYFERLAQLYLAEGFITKSIAIYKKIAKLAPEETRPHERLADLYVQQGVLSEARPLYLQLAEAHLRANRHQQAVELLRKLLDAEPDNLRVHLRLAEIYHAIGQDKEAAAAYLDAAQRLFDHRDHAEAGKLLERVLKLNPNDESALALKARALDAAGNRAEAAALLESLPSVESHAEASALLVEQYLQSSQPHRAAALASKVVERNPRSYELAYKVSTALVVGGEPDQGLVLLAQIREAMLEVGDHERLAQALTVAAQHQPGRLEPLEWLADLYSRTNDPHLADALTQLAEAAVAAGRLEVAQRAYEQLLDRNPENETALQGLDQVRAQIGPQVLELEKDAGKPAASADKPAAETPVEPAPAPAVPEPALDEETQRYIAQALTDVDLFSSYGLTQKAIALLETVLERAPRHTTTLEKLLDLHLGLGNERRTAQLAGQLEQIHLERGEHKEAERFSELRQRFQRAAGLAEEDLTAAARPAEFDLPMVDAEPVPAEGPPSTEAQAAPEAEPVVHEVDLSEEWAALSHQEEAMHAPPAEIAPPEAAGKAELRAEAPAAEPVAAPAGEFELLELEPAAVEASQSSADPGMSSDQFLSELTKEFAGLIPNLASSDRSASETPASPAPAQSQALSDTAQGAEPLREVFEQFRSELGEMGADEEDPETHYNLGTAYREMGLLDEAIGEFQKVANAIDKGRVFRYAMQCCTLLGLAFMEKGQPAIAVIWFERALETPGLDQESVLALRYDLGVAQELAGDRDAALGTFSQVYAINIDYRDVAERIALLGKPH